ncbi:16 kDa beta-galactoside-binding lectin-like [Conger conger]|uniref:16 kDa beta-galactoside-binding lectin-like n=1 Tax=Conger conger TaxID=82655 RepID=UPI002A5AA756|nr:16 kDa beta-galactoside-binding lectin-like [Conger conger]XP_061088713.1 16 kDa beta-galactoside-binding lectin-like [Conger conger]
MSNMQVKNMSFEAGKELKVTGVPKSDACGFSINVGHCEDRVALHFNPRFDCHGDHRTIVCNSKLDGGWNEEQRVAEFPFQQGEEFKVTISFDNDEFRIKLPDDNVVQFPNRLGDDKYKFIFIDGDVRIKAFKIK